MKKILSAIAVIAGLFSVPASANVAYQWVTTSLTGVIADEPGLFRPPQFIVTDDAFALGSMNFRYGQCAFFHPPCSIDQGDHSGFVGSINVTDGWEFEGLGVLTFDVTFNSDGTLTGQLKQGGFFTDLDFTGTGSDWTLIFNSDAANCSISCRGTGYWVQVPEPATLAMFGITLACLGWSRRRSSVT